MQLRTIKKKYEAIIVQLKVKIKDLEDIVNKHQHQVDTKMEVKKTPKTIFPPPLEAIVNRIDVLETMEMSQEDINVETKEESNGTSKYDEFKR